ncbi:MAG: hypothetical protein KA500_03780 [Rhodoluna sp.]|nr:hypothetical protein [Rhodoluna sp.]MBP6186671.1 hypothetical protein [Rhodoluna sp.]
MANPLLWLAMALFPNGRIANRHVKVSPKELEALKRENAESSKSAMGETVHSGLLSKYIPWKPLGTSSRYKQTGKSLEVNNLQDPSEF